MRHLRNSAYIGAGVKGGRLSIRTRVFSLLSTVFLILLVTHFDISYCNWSHIVHILILLLLKHLTTVYIETNVIIPMVCFSLIIYLGMLTLVIEELRSIFKVLEL